MSARSFRAATPADILSTLALIESAFRGDSAKRGWTHEADLLEGQRTDAAALADIIANPNEHLILAEREGQLIGCVMVADKGLRAGKRIGYLGMLTVDPAVQAAGWGGALVNEAERFARVALGAEIMEMTVIKQRPELVAWYLRRGYALTGEEAPFPLDDPRFGLPKTRELVFVVLHKALSP